MPFLRRRSRPRAAATALAALLVGLSVPAVAAAPSSGATPPPATGAGTGPNAPAAAPPDTRLPDKQLLTPPAAYTPTKHCVVASRNRKAAKNGVSWGQKQLDYTASWPLSTGTGVNVWIIDTGVAPNPHAFGNRLKKGADLIQSGGDGQRDCDGHGTLVAGLIGGAADARSGFAGVAPGAVLHPLRQSSDNYGVAKSQNQNNTAGTVVSLAHAIVYATRQHARVINISEASCSDSPASADAQTRNLVADVEWAISQGVVIVASAGNVSEDTACNRQNTPGSAIVTYALPASIKGVLAVGAVDQNGAPAAFSLNGPWVGVAAPGTDIVSTSPVGLPNQINEETPGGAPGQTSQPEAVQGTSFAAPYVSGLAALIIARNKRDGIIQTPAQIIARIEETAEHPSTDAGKDYAIGHGMIDIAAALTETPPDQDPGVTHPAATGPQGLAVPPAHRDPERDARRVALLGSLAVVVLAAAAFLTRGTRRRARRTERVPAGR